MLHRAGGRLEPRSLHEFFAAVAASHGDEVAFRVKRDGHWCDVTWSEQRAAVRDIARSLAAAGVEPGSCVAILSGTRLEWVQCDTALVGIGSVTVGIYPSSTAADCAHVLQHSAACLLIVENAELLEKVRAVRAEVPSLERLVILDGPGDAAAGVLSWSEFLALGAGVADAEIERRGRAVEPGDLASLVYTSGTTGRPKGVMITHANLLFTAESAAGCMPLARGQSTLLFLPLAHIFARLIVYLAARTGLVVAFAQDLTTLVDDLRDTRPHLLLGVPRIYEKFYERVMDRAASAGAARRALFHWALEVGRRAARHRCAGQSVPRALRLRLAVADCLVLRKVRAGLGGRLRVAVSGAAPLHPSLCEFFLACGITMLEGIGMTENTGLSNVNRPERIKPGTVGPVAPGVEMKLAADGEVLFRAGNVMRGYFKDAEATAEAIDADGWLHSGDVGEIDADGYLRITDRKKDLIITSGGKNVAPQRVESALRTSPYIGQAVACGDGEKYLTALLALDEDRIRRWASERGLDSTSSAALAAHPEVRRLIEGEVAECNRGLASYESIKKFRILPRPLSIAEGELTPTLKLRRKLVYERYRSLIDEMYRGS